MHLNEFAASIETAMATQAKKGCIWAAKIFVCLMSRAELAVWAQNTLLLPILLFGAEQHEDQSKSINQIARFAQVFSTLSSAGRHFRLDPIIGQVEGC